MIESSPERRNWTVTSRDVAQYALLPGIIPRLKELFRSPFAPLAAMMAEVLSTAALIPPQHPYLRRDQVGTYGVLDVLRVAAREIKWDLKHIDQIIVFFALLAAIVTVTCFFLSAAIYIAFPAASASNVTTQLPSLLANIYNFTATPNPGRDVALMLLDRTLGVVGDTTSGTFFGSDVPTLCAGGEVEMAKNPGCTPPMFPTPIHVATLALLRFYSTAIFMFTILFFLYLVSTVVIDVAMKGKPLGRDTNAFWTPLRVVAALGLMIPLAPQGLNSAQYIVLYSAKVGSAMATNAWGYFHAILDTQMGVTGRNPSGMAAYRYDMGGSSVIPISSPMAAKLQAPDVSPIVRFLHTVATCEYYYETYRGYSEKRQIQGYFYRAGKNPLPAYTEKDEGYSNFVSYKDALNYFSNGSIRIVFGSYDDVKKDGPMGGIFPLCGELVIPVTTLRKQDGSSKNPGATMAQELYYNYVIGLFDKTTYPRKLMDGYARQMVTLLGNGRQSAQCTDSQEVITSVDSLGNTQGSIRILQSKDGIVLTELGACNKEPPKEYMLYQQKLFQGIFQVLIDSSNTELAKPENFAISDDVLKRGWAAAGTWFQHVARINGDYVTAVRQMPYGPKQPQVVDKLRSSIIQSQLKVPDPKKFCSLDGNAGKSLSPEDLEIAKVLCQVNLSMERDFSDLQYTIDPNAPQDSNGINGILTDKNHAKTENAIFKLINTVIGTDFIFSMCRNADTHPFTQIVVYGRELMEGVIRNVTTGSAIAAASGVVSLGNADMGGALGKIAGSYHAFASMMFTGGFMLYYILPLLPFIYFFFAMLAWVKSIFEGLIGAPLWAFAHMKLDGNGFGTSGARQGYLLILEIILRPTIIVLALIMGLGVFSAAIYMLRETMEMVADTLGRPTSPDEVSCKLSADTLRNILDVFFFNIFYILLVYMIALSSFKLVDMVPNKIMRWFGSSPKSLADQSASSDHAGNRFTSQSFVVVANPMQKLIDQGDDLVSSISKSMAEVTDKKGNTERVQAIFGKDFMGQAKDALESGGVKDWSEKYVEAKKTEKEIKKMLAETTLPDSQRDDLSKKLKEAERQAKLMDPALLFEEAMKPNSTNLSELAETVEEKNALDERIQQMKDTIKVARPKVWDSLNIHSEGMSDSNAVQSKLKELVLGIKSETIKKKK